MKRDKETIFSNVAACALGRWALFATGTLNEDAQRAKAEAETATMAMALAQPTRQPFG